MKKDDPSLVSLAIGDGANDVSMILQADIGIGIRGKEGSRAADSSDIAICEFRYLWHLIFKHGRWNYKRFAMLLNYFYYKNFVYTIVNIYFMFDNCFSAMPAFPDAFLTLFNLCFTQFPVFCYALFERDVFPIAEQDGEQFRKFMPSLYFPG